MWLFGKDRGVFRGSTVEDYLRVDTVSSRDEIEENGIKLRQVST